MGRLLRWVGRQVVLFDQLLSECRALENGNVLAALVRYVHFEETVNIIADGVEDGLPRWVHVSQVQYHGLPPPVGVRLGNGFSEVILRRQGVEARTGVDRDRVAVCDAC